MGYVVPADCKFTKNDEWVRVEGGEAVVGVTDYAQHALSDIVYVELPNVGASYKQEQPFGSVESVKAASDVFMPIGGSVVAVNSDLESTPELVNQEPFGKGWLVRIKITDAGELSKLMDAAAYEAYCNERDA
jgi:glycine cleavage system H protein